MASLLVPRTFNVLYTHIYIQICPGGYGRNARPPLQGRAMCAGCAGALRRRLSRHPSLQAARRFAALLKAQGWRWHPAACAQLLREHGHAVLGGGGRSLGGAGGDICTNLVIWHPCVCGTCAWRHTCAWRPTGLCLHDAHGAGLSVLAHGFTTGAPRVITCCAARERELEVAVAAPVDLPGG